VERSIEEDGIVPPACCASAFLYYECALRAAMKSHIIVAVPHNSSITTNFKIVFIVLHQ
jgi:hypothetical protein